MTNSPPTPVVVFGAGGLSREVAWALDAPDARLSWKDGTTSSVEVVGHLDDNIDSQGTRVNGRPVVGGADWLADHPGHAVIVAVGKPSIRRSIVQRLSELGASFPTFRAAGTVVGDHGALGEGSIALPGVIITVNVQLGSFVLLNPHVSISHDCNIGDYCSLGPGVSLAGNVHVGPYCDIGTNASVIPGMRIGENTVIGAGACVTRDLPDNITAVGVPARIINQEKSAKAE